ncbi:MAG TPA: iron-containing alcohol dehydrogenase [Gaiellaceae bacterium]|jgi:maleylacetate reductase|nr:iron-containing alcohol dehydrogenase [Gaiellaceae bacterium]
MIVRFGLEHLGPVLGELGCARPLLVTSERFAGLELPVAARFTGVRRHAPLDTVAAATRAAEGADGLVGLGGGSAIDTAKAVSAATGLPLVAVPTTYAGAEWTPYFGLRDEARGIKAGGSGARTAAAVYEPELTLALPLGETVGTALNALAHCAEALYAGPHADAVAGARLIARHLPAVVERPRDLAERAGLLRGAMHAGKALGERGLFLAHALAQALGGRYGLPHGALNALCLAPALRFNEPAVPGALAALAEALGVEDAPAEVERLAALGGFRRLRDLGIPEDDLAAVAAEAAARPGARANPRPVSAQDVEALYRSAW